MRTKFLYISVLASGPRVKLASCISALTLRWFTDCSKVVVLVLVLLFVCVEVLQPSQPNGVMSSVVVLLFVAL